MVWWFLSLFGCIDIGEIEITVPADDEAEHLGDWWSDPSDDEPRVARSGDGYDGRQYALTGELPLPEVDRMPLVSLPVEPKHRPGVKTKIDVSERRRQAEEQRRRLVPEKHALDRFKPDSPWHEVRSKHAPGADGMEG